MDTTATPNSSRKAVIVGLLATLFGFLFLGVLYFIGSLSIWGVAAIEMCQTGSLGNSISWCPPSKLFALIPPVVVVVGMVCYVVMLVRAKSKTSGEFVGHGIVNLLLTTLISVVSVMLLMAPMGSG